MWALKGRRRAVPGLIICVWKGGRRQGYFDKEGEVQITIPRWAQAVLIPVAIFLALYFAKVASHAVFVFLVATVVAVLLNPVVLGMGRIKVPRWAAVPIVYLAFVAVIVLVFILLGPALVGQFQRLFEAIPGWLTDFNGLLADLQAWLASNNVQVNLQINTTDIVDWLESNGARSVGTLFSLGVSVAGLVVNIFLTVVVSFYMLIDGKRIFRFLCRLAPGTPEVKNEYVRGLQTAFSRFVRGQALLAATIGLACGLAIWILSWDVVGVWPDGGQYALLFGFWAGVTEIIPYIGPWIGAVPPVIAAFFYSPTAALVVIIVYFAIQQLESHILAPNIVGSSVGVHPLVVIFVLLAGAQIGGIVGIIASLPLLAMLRHTLQFYKLRVSSAPWAMDDGIVLIPARSGAPPPRRVRPPGVPEAEDYESPTASTAIRSPGVSAGTPPAGGSSGEPRNDL
jgi:predicted PurR-regulated permease PerM